jgi:hypothetical protein
MQVPTILIGLGGTGSQIVDQVYSRLPEKVKDLVAIHAFDTDVNDISKLKNLKKEDVTQTSTNYTVGQYLEISGALVKEWFPDESKELHRKTLTDGAGQIRAVSRLAYRAAMEKNALSNLERSIIRLNRLREDGKLSNIRVVIVTTLAGGTGSGIFLQTAMYIRELLRKNFNRENVLIRGVFMLPDTLVLNNTLDKQEHDNVMSNAYAAIKELNAIFRVTANVSNIQIEMEYRPNQADDQGRNKLTLGFDNLPYDYCVLFDFENEDGRNIGSFTNYKNLVTRATYFDMFTPMTHTLFSKQDNQIRKLCEEKGLNRYCSSALASVKYPYEDILQHHSLQWVSSFLSEQWLIVDEQIKRERAEYELDLERGINREKFEEAERFIKIIESRRAESPFFRKIHREANQLDDKNNPIAFKAYKFLERVNEGIESFIKDDESLMRIQSRCEVKEDMLSDKVESEKHIKMIESALIEYKEKVSRFITDNRNQLADKFVTYDAPQLLEQAKTGDFSQYNCLADHQLNYWMINAHEPVQPLAVRFILYQLAISLKKEIGTIQANVNNLQEQINNYDKIFDDPNTESKIETASDRIRAALKQGMIKKVFSANEFKLFTEEYMEHSSAQLSRLNELLREQLKLEVFKVMQAHINSLSDDFKKYFDILLMLKNSLFKELQTEARRHDESDDKTVIYVLAKAGHKQKQWESVKGRYIDEGIPPVVSKQVYMGIFLRLCKRYRGVYTSEMQEETIRSEFERNVQQWCLNKLKTDESLNISVFEALGLEAQYEGIDENKIDSYKKDKITSLNTLTRAFILSYDNDKLAQIAAWGVHPEIRNFFSEAFIAETFQSEQIEDDAFSRYEIVKQKLIYGLKAENLLKFREPEGRYYKAYARVINKVLGNPNIPTPHLDKRWHLPAYLPSLTEEGIRGDKEKINRAFVLGLASGSLKQLNDHGGRAWFYYGDTSGMQMINIAPDKPAGKHPYQLYEALSHNPAIVDKVLHRYHGDREKEMAEKSDIQEHSFIKNCDKIGIDGKDINLFQLILSYPDFKAGEEKLTKESLELLETACKELFEYFEFVIGKHKSNEVKRQYLAYSKKLLQESLNYQEAEEDSIVKQQWNIILKKFELV